MRAASLLPLDRAAAPILGHWANHDTRSPILLFYLTHSNTATAIPSRQDTTLAKLGPSRGASPGRTPHSTPWRT